MESSIRKHIIQRISKILNINVLDVTIPKQGMDSQVFILKDQIGNEYAVKYSKETHNDHLALKLIHQHKVNIPVPFEITTFKENSNTVLVFQKIDYPLLESVSDKGKYIPSMINNLIKIHTIKSKTAGLLSTADHSKTWKEIFLYKYSGKHPSFNWNEISLRNNVDSSLILSSVEKLRKKFEDSFLLNDNYSLIHTDFNQRNLFVDPKSDQLTGIIDWSEAMFGDPLYDFARVRMFIWHFNLSEHILKSYFKSLSLTDESKQLEELYFINLVLEYIAWYSEEQNNFNNGRLTLHQQFLREYKW